MDNSQKVEEKFNFDITPEYFSKNNISPIYLKLCIESLLSYEKYNQYIVNKLEINYKNIDKKYLEKLPFDYKEKVKKVIEGIKTNQAFFTKIANLYMNKFNDIKLSEQYIKDFQAQEQIYITKYYLKLLTREWTEEGREEREKSITPIIEELKKYYNYEDKSLMEKGVQVLVISSHLGRMVYELAKLGYNVEANEKSYFYLLVANYLFNYSKKNENCICPRIHSFSSSFSEESVIKKHYFPDVDICEDLKNVGKDKIKITKREFEVEYYNKENLFDCVINVFTTDEVRNIIEFTERVHKVLKKGGIWINLGGLYSMYTNYGGINLTWEEWRHVMEKSGFVMKREEKPVIPYLKIKDNSLPFTRGAVFFTAEKI